MDGVSLAKKLREKGKNVNIIFTTGVADYMQEGFEVEALHYLLKPIKREKVWECLYFTRISRCTCSSSTTAILSIFSHLPKKE